MNKNNKVFKQFIVNNLINTISSVIIGLSNWAFSFIILKTVTDNTLSSYNAFAGLLMIFSFPANWILLSTTQSGEDFLKFLKSIFFSNKERSYIALVLFSITIFIISSIVKIPNYAAVILLVATGIGFIASYYKGLLQSELRFITLSITGFIEVSFKILLFYILYFVGFESSAPIVAIFIQLLIVATGLFLLLKNQNFNKIKKNVKAISKNTLYFSLLYIVFTNIDVVLARVLLDVTDNKQYIASLQLVKLILFGALALQNVLLPSVQKVKKTSEKIIMMGMVLFLIIIATIIVSISIYIFHDNIVQIFEISQTSLLQLLSFVAFGALFAIGQIPLTILLAENSTKIGMITIFVLTFQLTSYLIFGSSLSNFIWIYGINSLVLFLTSLFIFLKETNWLDLSKMSRDKKYA